MGKTIKRALPWVVLALVVIVVGIFVLGPKAPPRQSFKNPDGTVVTFLQATYGPSNKLVAGNTFQRALYKILPEKWKSLSRADALSVNTADTNVPTFWMEQTVANTTGLPSAAPPNGGLRVQSVDEYGCVYSPNGYSTGNSWFPDRVIHYYHLNCMDPHGKIVGIFVYEDNAMTRKLGMFVMPGAKLSPVPRLEKSADPVKRDGEFEFQLVAFATGLKAEPYSYGATGKAQFTQAIFHITKNGGPIRGWYPSNMKITDAHGKAVRVATRADGSREGDRVFNFEGALDAAAGPFKLRTEFVHHSHFETNELTTVKDVPFPGDSESVSPGLEASALGRRITVEQIYGPYGERPNNSFQAEQPFLRARLSPATNAIHLDLAGATNDAGEAVMSWGMYPQHNGEYYFSFAPKTKAKTVTLTFAVHQSRFAEFMATPVVMETNGAARK